MAGGVRSVDTQFGGRIFFAQAAQMKEVIKADGKK